jgi:rhodanese-related sulfurtransferase
MFDPRSLPTVSPAEARDRLDAPPGEEGRAEASRPMLVDVREPDEFARFRAEGAVLFPLSTFILRLQQLPRDRPLLMICNSGARSAQATAYLLGNGWADVTNVAGGMQVWIRSGLPYRQGTPEPGEGDLPA